jgi:transcriptional regulator
MKCRYDEVSVTERADIFAPASSEQVLRLVLAHPLAWVVSSMAEAFARHRCRCDRASGAAGVSRRSKATWAFQRALRRPPARWRALILFSGPEGTSPWVSDRTWAPTWNYAIVQFLVTIAFEEPARLDAHLADLVESMERDRPRAWQPSEMGARYEALKRRIVPFEAKVVEQRAKFKLGQDERDSVFADISAALERAGSEGLLAWMRELNPGR